MPLSLINYLIESSFCLLIFYLFYRLLLKRQQHFNTNRAYLLLTSVLSLLIPLLEIPVATRPVDVALQGYLLLPPVEAEIVNHSETVFPSWQNMLIIIYLAGGMIALFRTGKELYRILIFIQANRQHVMHTGTYRLIPTHGQFATSSFFSFLFWNDQATISQEEREHIIAHESVHIAEKHSYDVLYFSLLKIFYWFNPLVYLYHKETAELHEYIADAQVVAHHNLKSYQGILAKQAAFTENMSLANHFYKSQILKRLKMMERNKSKVFPYRVFIAIPLLAITLYVFSCQEESEMAKLDKLSEQYKNARTDEERNALADADEVFMVVEDQPEPEGGMQAFYDYIRTNLKYPTEARQAGVEGKVFVQFVVEKDGSLNDIKVLKGIGAGCDEEVVRLMKNASAWNPGKQRGKFVKVRMVMPITFKLNAGSPKAEADNIKGDQDEMNVQIIKRGDGVEGTVLSENGNPVAGANVIIKGTTQGTVTNREGKFKLQLPGNSQELAISHISFQTALIQL